MGKLFIVATPVGNLKDITLRALEVLKDVDLILAEDTRVTKKLLMHYNIDTPILSYHQHSSENRKLEILNYLLQGKDIALVTDAGTPGVSDPGNELIDFVNTKSSSIVQIIPIPGPSAITAALSICGFDISRYIFIGFFPKKKKSKVLNLIAESRMPVIYFDSPYRLIKNLEYLQDELGDREVFVGRELTKLHETIYRGPIGEVIQKLEKDDPRGEAVVIVEKCP